MKRSNDAHEPFALPEQPMHPPPTTAGALPSEDLLRGQKTVVIEHNGTVYRLQSTRAGKLILTK